MGTKLEIRKKLLQKRRDLKSEFKKEKSDLIFKNFLKIRFKKTIRTVCIYSDFDNEVQTGLFIKFFQAQKVKISVPSLKEDKWILSKFDGQWTSNKLRIGQPRDLTDVKVEDVDLAIIPGVAFSNTGNRIGYGKGVYDKLFSKSNSLFVGIAYDFQIIQFDAEVHDLVMDYIVTEKRVLKIT